MTWEGLSTEEDGCSERLGQTDVNGHLFVSYSTVDGAEFALRLVDTLESGAPSYTVWYDKRDLRPARDWDEQIDDALRTCQSLILVMTKDSVKSDSVCKQEWSRALQYGKQVIPLLADAEAEIPFRLSSRQYILFENFTSGIAQLRQYLAWTTTNEGILSELNVRLSDARRELARTALHRRSAIEAEILELQQKIARRNLIIKNAAGTSSGIRDTLSRVRTREQQPGGPRPVAGLDHDNSAGPIHFLTESQLEELGVPNCIGLDPVQLGAEFVAASIVIDSAICNYEGVDLGRVKVNDVGKLDDFDSHPEYIRADRASSAAPVPNRPKAHLIEWHAPVIDQGDILTLDLARSDYWTSEATKRCIDRVQRDVRDFRLDLMQLPRRLDVHLVVVSEEDGRLLLTRRGSHVATEPSTWMVSVGESMDWEQDKGPDGVPHPLLTARRCLAERDELNLPADVANSASFRLIALATEWSEMLVNLIVVAKLPTITFTEIRRHFRRGENSEVGSVPFSLTSCTDLLKSQSYAGSLGRGPKAPISDISRVALLAALTATYSLSEVARAADLPGR